MPTFGIDINPATRAQKTGTEWYTHQLIEAMKKQPLQEGERLLFYSRETLRWPFKRLWTQIRLSFEMLRRPPDVLFVPAHAVPRIHPKKTVTTIHDVGFKRLPQLYEAKARRYLESTTAFAIKHCAKILTPSEFTKRELVELYNVPADKIVVTPLAPANASDDRRGSHPPPDIQAKYHLTSNYFLTVSRMESKKNIATLIRAFEVFKLGRGVGDPFQLVLVGKPGFGYGEIKTLIDRSPARESILELGWVEEGEVPALMQGAFAYVYPSWYEGLGISALEAMNAGAPLIASDIPALHEAAGDAALYARPDSPEEFAKVMTRLVEEGRTREEMIEKGRERVREMSWEQTAEMTWNVLRLV